MALKLTAHATQDWLHATAMTVAKHEWSPNSPDLNLLDYHVWGAMLKAYHKLDITSWTSKPSTTEELFSAGGHFEHSV